MIAFLTNLRASMNSSTYAAAGTGSSADTASDTSGLIFNGLA